ncbi:hypothetical protein MGG_08627 [Pyricularia oryzae 70-15]|uniref:GDP/GTP exchange factor Sec2 N-terminal domain-containing protein n=3 Tax=Pyricularia oryzae TaxID=318829 RepID=G4ML17_PYRO7|nr:uncharacterized protein MGG_08627 [Pyricularia oryzae 70-15]EHA58444.1 hypothetical protein MGG_08627 [Pyricularia oryzae 70-15]ELQ35839.1 hypothetical protein OOU_Y34scaffold00685g17 [Pyricularia oryzae Y34]
MLSSDINNNRRPAFRPQAQFPPRREKLFETAASSSTRHQTPPPRQVVQSFVDQQGVTSPLSAASSPTSSVSSSSSSTSGCPRCGFDNSPTSSAATSPTASTRGEDDDPTSLADAQRQIEDLRLQVRTLNEKAAVAVEKWASYEDELARLRRQLKTSSTAGSGNPPQTAEPAAAGHRIGSLWGGKTTSPPATARDRSSASSKMDKTTDDLLMVLSKEQQLRVTGDQTMDDLLVALTREQQLRAAAEARELDASREVEELSASLFEEANEMVATERRARAKLEERVDILEKRDVEKKRRLERLELAVGRIERVKKLLEES